MTKLYFAMPGLGKTTWVKRQNEGKTDEGRPAIDFDYKGTRFNRKASEVSKAQAALFNAFAKNGVKAITSFPTMIDFDSLNPSLFDVYFIVPKEGGVNELVDRAIQRGDDPKQFFITDYRKNGEKYRLEWIDLYNKVKQRLKAKLIEVDPGQYFSDVIPDLK